MVEAITNIEVLREIALDQHGFVTTGQALEAGVTYASLSMLTKRGRLERVAHGIYRVPQVPATQYDRYMLAVLWTGVPEAALSHDTALDAYGVCDINPTSIHVTVSKGRRIKRNGGDRYTLHRQDLTAEQITWWEQIPIVTLPTAIEQCANGNTPDYLLTQAIDNGKRMGLLTDKKADELANKLQERNDRYLKSR